MKVDARNSLASVYDLSSGRMPLRDKRPWVVRLLLTLGRKLVSSRLGRALEAAFPPFRLFLRALRSLRYRGNRAGEVPRDEMGGTSAGNAKWDYSDPRFGVNFAEHRQALSDMKTYLYEEEAAGNYVRGVGDPRVVALYLPQFYPIPQNDLAWGKGFTEWSNVVTTSAGFVGQQQPVLPTDLGFYDLRLPEVMEAQISLASKYGIFGFQFYYYWFSGAKVLERPIETFFEHKEWDFHFSICWANENWTRKWDGGDSEVIIGQTHRPDDPERFIEDVAPMLCDERYICEDGKPILTVYRVEQLDDAARYAQVWRSYFREHYGRELWLIACTSFSNVDPQAIGFDATMDFAPINSPNPSVKPYISDAGQMIVQINPAQRLDPMWKGGVIDLRHLVREEVEHITDNPNDYLTIAPSWCNDSRRKGGGGTTFHNSSPSLFAWWLNSAIGREVHAKRDAPLVFINAWNEWAESAMLEPSRHLGHANLRRVAEVLAKFSGEPKNREPFVPYGLKFSTNARTAVIVHLFYPDMWPKIAERLERIDHPFDLFVTVVAENANIDLGKVSRHHGETNILVVPNRGRDVLPFLTLATRIRELGKYEFLLKLHTKKSLQREDGEIWFRETLEDLLPDDLTAIWRELGRKSTGVVGPGRQLVSLKRHIGSDEALMRWVLSPLSDEREGQEVFVHPENYPYFGGTMFWCRMDFLDPLLDLFLLPSDFPSENGQTDGTLAHAVERVLGGALHYVGGREMFEACDGEVQLVSLNRSYDRPYRFGSD